MLEKIRSMFWKQPRVEADYDEATFVTERPPIGSTFNPDGSYVTPEGIVISKVVRDEVTNLRALYRDVGAVLQGLLDGDMSYNQHLKELTETAVRYHSQNTFPKTEVTCWLGSLPPGQDAKIQGKISTQVKDSKLVLRPKNVLFGPLYCEVSLDFKHFEVDTKLEKSGKGKHPKAEAAKGESAM